MPIPGERKIIPAQNFILSSSNVLKSAMPHDKDAISTDGRGFCFVVYELGVDATCTANLSIEYALDTGPREFHVLRFVGTRNHRTPPPGNAGWQYVGTSGKKSTGGWNIFGEDTVDTIALHAGDLVVNMIRLTTEGIGRAEGAFPHIRKIIFTIL